MCIPVPRAACWHGLRLGRSGVALLSRHVLPRTRTPGVDAALFLRAERLDLRLSQIEVCERHPVVLAASRNTVAQASLEKAPTTTREAKQKISGALSD